MVAEGDTRRPPRLVSMFYGTRILQRPGPWVAASTVVPFGSRRRLFTEVFGRFVPRRAHTVLTPPPSLATKAPMSVASRSLPSAVEASR